MVFRLRILCLRHRSPFFLVELVFRSFSCEFWEDPSALSLVSLPSIDFGLFDFADFLWFSSPSIRSLDELWILTRAVRRRGANRSGWHHEMHYPAATCVYRADHPDLLHGVPTDDAGELPGQHPRGKCRHHEIGRCSSGRRDAGEHFRAQG